MAKLGILVHVYHLGALDWDKLTFGDAENSKMGCFATLAEVVLRRIRTDEIVSIVIGSTDNYKDGLAHGEYAKKYCLDRLDELPKFSQIKPLLEGLSEEESKKFRELMQDIAPIHPIKNTAGEVAEAAKLFAEMGIEEVVQIGAASHAPRCVQLQQAARADDTIPVGQYWLFRGADVCFAGAEPLDTVIFEPPHRDDDPMLGFEPKMVDVLRPYQYALDSEDKKELIQDVAAFMKERVDTNNPALLPK